MELVIISPYYRQQQIVAWLDVVTPYGNFVIQKGHAPMVVDLLFDHSFSFALENGVQKTIHVRQGFLNVTRTQATIIMNEL